MRGTINRANTRSLVALLGCIAWCATGVKASPIVANETFTTSGTVSASGVTGAPVISFQGINNGALTTGSPFTLGQFTISAPTAGSTTYNNTHFLLQFQVNQINGQAPQSNESPITIPGVLNGTVSSSGQSDLKYILALILPEPPYLPNFGVAFQAGGFWNLLNFNSLLGGLALVPGPNGSGTIALRAEMDLANVPEPSTIMGFGLLFAIAASTRMISFAHHRNCTNASEANSAGGLPPSRDP